MLEKQALMDISSQLEAEKIQDQELIEIQIPITLPYPVQEGVIEKRSGDFFHNGQSFSLVKQKYENDVLTVWCYRNIEVEKINELKASIDKKSGDHQSDNLAFSITIKLLQDFLHDQIQLETASNGWVQSLMPSVFTLSVLSPYSELPYSPPRSI